MNYFKKHFKDGQFFKTKQLDNTQVVEEVVLPTLEGKCENCDCVDTKECDVIVPEIVEEKQETVKTTKRTYTKKTSTKSKKTDL